MQKPDSLCMAPWTHTYLSPQTERRMCCASREPAQNFQQYIDTSAGTGRYIPITLDQHWNSEHMKSVRRRMMAGETLPECEVCNDKLLNTDVYRTYFWHLFKHKYNDIWSSTDASGATTMKPVSWDYRFSNLCNLRCRSCGSIFSSQWYQDQVKIAGPEWAIKNTALNYAGQHETDMWEQLIEHIDHVEQIYFAGGEPLMMEEHYLILEELERRKRFDVRLIYNTNFTQVKLKNRSVFDYWKKFESVAVGASLDAMGPRAEYIRKGTVWKVVEENRKNMIEICPNVDFYISPTLSIMNALHLPDFHKAWVEKGLIHPQDLNVNILQDPMHFRIDIATKEYKEQIQQKFEGHLEWLRPLDTLHRATVGFESAITFMNKIDNAKLIDTFWAKTSELDYIRNEDILDVIPELTALI